jgi:hypothetical protein
VSSPLQEYRLDWDLALPMLRRARLRASSEGVEEKSRLLDAVKELRRELARAPLEWGEPKFRYKHIGMIVCLGFSHRFRVEYGVDPDARIVFVRWFGDSFE